MKNNMDSIDLSRQLVPKIEKLARQATEKLDRRIMLMEVCGTHTTVISKSGLRSLLADHMELRSGPGCPVCVTDQADIDRTVALSRIPGIVIATFGDMMRVPGTDSSLEIERAKGACVEMFYSPHDAVTYALKNPHKEVIFLGVGFETTIPAVAMSVMEARSQGLESFSVLALHKIVPPAMRALLDDADLHIDGFILPGHVCTITGRKVFDFVSSDYHLPAVIAGFEPIDIIQAIYLLLEQILGHRAETLIGYTRLVHEDGNPRARMAIDECFDTVDASWRGFGPIPGSGLALKAEYAAHDATLKFPLEIPESPLPQGCSCGEILRGRLTPRECPLFSVTCTPSNPVGPCMVSSEGACAAYYQYSE